ncbi:hypothetical protein N7470_009432 [Penicillium chermesinum]|nr:hypothetical protein N7470_009432 [Penicillium chermesinum]
MPSKTPKVPNLDLSAAKSDSKNAQVSSLSPGAQNSDNLSPLTPRSPRSMPGSPVIDGTTIRPVKEDSSSKNTSPMSSPSHLAVDNELNETLTEPSTPGITAIPQYPSPKQSPKHTRDASRSFFGQLKAPKSSHKTQRSDGSDISTEPPKSRGHSSRGHSSRGASRDGKQPLPQRLSESTPDLPTLLLQAEEAEKMDDNAANRPMPRRPSLGLAKLEEFKPESQKAHFSPTTVQPERSRLAIPADSPSVRRDKSTGGSMVPSHSLSQVSGVFNTFKQSSSGAADHLGKAGKGFLKKITRSGSTNERDLVTDDNYVCSTISLPLFEQARKTRIAKKLEDCRDKTEFWMPALPYRCIDYLNFKGCEEEGLYRVPGSGKEVKYWQRRFDTELDVDLFDVPDLYDINTIGSLFKGWLRELPDEIFPKATQDLIAQKCEGATSAPQLLRDELSKLPPYNYYLLFAITCHLNLLHSYVDQNKMDYRNLCICVQPCMKIDTFCFQFLVCDWKNCWQGCWTEKEWVQKEKELDEAEARKAEEKAPVSDERAISSSSSSEEKEKPRPQTRDRGRGRKARPKDIETSHTSHTSHTTHTAHTAHTSHTRSVSQLPELGPPLSPIKI